MHTTEIKSKGKFHMCIVPKAVVIGESLMTLVVGGASPAWICNSQIYGKWENGGGCENC